MTVPTLAVQVNGLLQVSGDNFNTYCQTANVVTDLRAFIGVSGMKIHMTGYTTPNDGGQGFFYWNATGTGPDDSGVTNIVPTGSVVGCWTRVLATGVGNGTVTSVSITSANGVSGSVQNASTTPAITLTLGAITPSSVTASGNVTGSNLSGTNTGDQTITLTGDVIGSGTGALAATISTNAVSNSKFRQSVALSVVGNASNATTNVADISATAANQVLTVNAAGNAVSWQNTALTMGVVSNSAGVDLGAITTYTAGPYTLGGVSSIDSYVGYQVSLPVLSGNASIGSNPAGVKIIQASITGTASYGSLSYGVWVTPATNNSSGASLGNTYGALFQTASMSNGGAMTNAYGVQVQMPTVTGAGSAVLSALGVDIQPPSVSSSGAITNCNGININNMGASGITTSKGINIAAQSGSSTNWDLFIADGFYVKSDGTVTVGNAALATNATAGFIWITTSAGAPTGVATAPYSNAAALHYDSTNNFLYIRCNGTWRKSTVYA